MTVYADAVIACVDLVGRAGASGFEMAWDCPHEPGAPKDHNCPDLTWSATAAYQDARIIADGHRTPTAAAMALSERLLSGALCRCQQPVALSDEVPGCRWRLVGQKWEPGCDAEPLHFNGQRGDHAAIVQAMAEPATRAERRATKKGRNR